MLTLNYLNGESCFRKEMFFMKIQTLFKNTNISLINIYKISYFQKENKRAFVLCDHTYIIHSYIQMLFINHNDDIIVF